jgi:serralysin
MRPILNHEPLSVIADQWAGAGARSFRSKASTQALFGTSVQAFFGSVGEAQPAKYTDAFAIDGVGDLKPPLISSLLITTDNVPGDTSTTATLTVDAPHTISTIDTIGDQDFYAVTLEAGKSYQIGMYGYAGGPNGAPLQDSYIELYDSTGHLIVSGDGGADTPANTVNSGFDVLLTFEADVTGTYYINARAFDNDPTVGGSTGEGVGDYELFVHDATNDPNIYHPYYDVDSPLYAIDWGTRVNKVNQSAANPDGNEGIRPTGNAQGTPVYGSSLDIPALAAAQGVDITGKNVITIYFAKAGDVFVSNDPTNPGLPPATITATGVKDYEHTAVITALGEFSKVADIVYLEVDDRDDADFVYTSYAGTPGPGVSLLGSMSPPDESDEGLAQFNNADERWNARDLAQGGFSYVTLIHEFGHGHGLAHPHDNGGHSGIMRGVVADGPVADYTTGDFDLNQSVFTMMSYEDGWQTSPYGNASTTAGYGYLGSLMAFDIAAIQDKYGVNEDYNNGDDTYTLKDVNAAGTYYSSIWDGGGTDKIVYVGTKDANIDLRPASLQYEYGGGGWVSYAYGIFGGFTIANSVTIENAITDAGNDTLTGNSVDNRLESGAGSDTINLQFGGNDTVLAGDGNDILYYGAALTAGDNNDGGAGARDVMVLQGAYDMIMAAQSLVGIEFLSLQSGAVTKFGDVAGNRYDYNLTMIDVNVGAGQQLTVNAQSLLAGEDLTFNGSAETNGSFFVYAGHGVDTLTGGAGNDIFFFEGDRWGSSDVVNGGGGRDSLVIAGVNGINHIAFGAASMSGIESISVNNRFATDPTAAPSYELVFDDGNVAAGQTLIVNGSSLSYPQSINADGSAETDGHYQMFGGAGSDTFTGGGLSDLIYAAGGSDTLRGGGGADTFQYRSESDSMTPNADQILDFQVGSDKLDLHFMDANSGVAGDQDFAFIGSSAFSGSAGQLRATLDSGHWTIEGDTNGDGAADFRIVLTTTTADPITSADFIV